MRPTTHKYFLFNDSNWNYFINSLLTPKESHRTADNFSFLYLSVWDWYKNTWHPCLEPLRRDDLSNAGLRSIIQGTLAPIATALSSSPEERSKPRLERQQNKGSRKIGGIVAVSERFLYVRVWHFYCSSYWYSYFLWFCQCGSVTVSDDKTKELKCR